MNSFGSSGYAALIRPTWLVRHYLANIFPNGFKAQVVCHSKLAAVRYQKSIHAALVEVIAEEQGKASPDAIFVDRLKFLRAAVVISSDGTNEAAYVTEARKQARAWNVVDYIGLTENLTEALTLYAAADKQQELAQGLKGITSEVPVPWCVNGLTGKPSCTWGDPIACHWCPVRSASYS